MRKLKDILLQRKEKLKKTIKLIAHLLAFTCILLLFDTFIINLFNNKCFFKSSITDVVAIFIAIIFAYYYVEQKNDGRKQKEIIENNVRKIQKYIYDEEIRDITSKKVSNSLTRSIKIRKIKNLISYLNDYSKKYDFEKQYNDICENFKEYQVHTETMAQDNDYSLKSKNHVIRIIETLDDNLEELIHEIYIK